MQPALDDLKIQSELKVPSAKTKVKIFLTPPPFDPDPPSFEFSLFGLGWGGM